MPYGPQTRLAGDVRFASGTALNLNASINLADNFLSAAPGNWVLRLDLTAAVLARMVFSLTGAYIAGSYIFVRYSPAYSLVFADYLDIAAPTVLLPLDGAVDQYATPWRSLVAGARRDVFVAICGGGGNGAGGPALRQWALQFR